MDYIHGAEFIYLDIGPDKFKEKPYASSLKTTQVRKYKFACECKT